MPLISCFQKALIYRGRKYWRNWSCSVTDCAMSLAILEFDRGLTTPTRNRLRMPLSGQTISRFVIAFTQIRPDRLEPRDSQSALLPVKIQHKTASQHRCAPRSSGWLATSGTSTAPDLSRGTDGLQTRRWRRPIRTPGPTKMASSGSAR
jgi:hypothetical protein